MISSGLKTPINREDIFQSEIKESHLKRIDKVFEKGLHYYLDSREPATAKEASVFFRKQRFATDELNIGAVKVVNKFEELKLSLAAIARLSDLELERKLPEYNVKQDPRIVAREVRELVYPGFLRNRRDFLKSLIAKLADHHVLVFEFVETWNKKEKANIDGFFLKPNVIVVKRHPAFTREIFTLVHELGHYLTGEEEIEKIDYQYIANTNLSKTERWCNDFAYFFLAGDFADMIDSLEKAGPSNDYHHEMIETISEQTHLSKIALFTRLLLQKKITKPNYKKVKADFDERYRKKKEEQEKEKQRLKDLGIQPRGSVPRPIPSPLFISTIQTAFHEGVIDEYEAIKRLNIKAEKFEEYLQ